ILLDPASTVTVPAFINFLRLISKLIITSTLTLTTFKVLLLYTKLFYSVMMYLLIKVLHLYLTAR
ncbi:MAG: hypothetical protein OEW99_12110, partial [Gammaproteobacteria bacterium]|nr:hypothetical protein [Gammaproteobacteria bacterium]